MDISILIPVYNWDIASLLNKVFQEIEYGSLCSRVEVIVIDDCSTDENIYPYNALFISENLKSNIIYERLERNAGRSAIRNLLASRASGDFLLFLDCDVVPDEADFIGKYLLLAEDNSFDVVCGGISYRARIMNGAEYDFHACLGNRKEVKPAAERERTPWRHILTSNIMVRKSVFQEIPFDERFTGYGYEDIEWGLRLAEKFRILHIDNTASHLGLVTKTKAYEKMQNSVANYLLLREICPEAFAASAISKAVALFAWFSVAVLNFLDRAIKRRFFSDSSGNRLDFVLFQLNFAVLLALAIKKAR